MYLLKLSSNRFICLWAFGILIGEVGKRAAFLRRGSFKVMITRDIMPEHPSTHLTLENLKLSPLKGDQGAIQIWSEYRVYLFSTIIGYERWIENQMGSHYRQECANRWRYLHFDSKSIIPTLTELSSNANSQPISQGISESFPSGDQTHKKSPSEHGAQIDQLGR
jgi:hypothetical protein